MVIKVMIKFNMGVVIECIYYFCPIELFRVFCVTQYMRLTNILKYNYKQGHLILKSHHE
jgi:hypothetical protein